MDVAKRPPTIARPQRLSGEGVRNLFDDLYGSEFFYPSSAHVETPQDLHRVANHLKKQTKQNIWTQFFPLPSSRLYLHTVRPNFGFIYNWRFLEGGFVDRLRHFG